MTFVLDNSVAIAWCFEDEQTPAVMRLLDRTIAGGAFAPSLFRVEALNVLLMAQRRRRIDEEKALAFGTHLFGLPITMDEDGGRDHWHAIWALAQFHRLTAYDATYLDLARRLSLPLATRDRALISAANAAGVPLLETL